MAGLTSAEAAARLKAVGPNQVGATRHLWALRTLLHLLVDPLVLILLTAALISGFVGEVVNATIIVVMVLLSVSLDFYQVARSDQAARKLQSLVQPTARVIRDGQSTEIPATNIVPGDVVEIRAGDLIPADGVLARSTTLDLDEAALTGESLPVSKEAGETLFAGTSVVSGMGQMEITATGSHTQFGAISRSLVERAPASEFEIGTRRFGYLILRTVLGLVLFVFLVNALHKRPPLDSFLFALALAVGLTPEFLPMIVTVTLGEGALRMSRSKVIVRRLEAVENLGSMDILCSDKTGTLTKGAVELKRHVDLAGAGSDTVLRLACVNSALESGVRSPLDDAILACRPADFDAGAKVDELPLDFERRRISILATSRAGPRLVTKGAPEGLLPLCDRVETAAGPQEFAPALREQADATFAALSREGFHVLAVAWKPEADGTTTISREDEQGLIFAGFVGFLDPPDPSARQTVADLRESGVAIKVLTGDAEVIARAICADVGIPTETIVHGDDLEKMSDQALAVVVERTDLFVRVSPAQKNRLIRALKHNGHAVGYIGDGINDAPSLHAADVGISVANAVGVAREAADIILLEKSLAAVYQGVREGRKSFGNIMKYVLMGTSSNFGNMLSMAGASAFLPFLPLLPAQILLNNFLYDLSQLTIPTDNVDADYLVRPRRWDAPMIRGFMFGIGPISSIYDFLTFGVLLALFHADHAVFRSGWFIESLTTQVLVILVIRTAGNPFRSRPSRLLLLSLISSVVVGLVVVYSPVRSLLGFGPLPLLFLPVLVLMTATYLVLVQVLKGRFFRQNGLPPKAPITRGPEHVRHLLTS